jgi:hypothetical protein
VPLPNREISVLDGQFHQHCFLAGLVSLVEGAPFLEENSQGPAIKGNVMNGQEQDMLVIPDPKQDRT